MMTTITRGERLRDPIGSGAMHVALFYSGESEYIEGVDRFTAPAVEAGEPIAIAVPGPKADLLRRSFDGCRIEMFDMVEMGRNPARIIPAVEELLARREGRLLHYVGEPIWAGRSHGEIREATRHEALINLAWPGAHVRVLCPYDVDALDPYVLVDAERTHPHLIRGGGPAAASESYAGAELPLGCDEVLSAPGEDALTLPFGLPNLYAVRSLVRWMAGQAGMSPSRTADLVLGINELATNAVRHAHGGGLLRVWRVPGEVVCQVEDAGHIHDPLAGLRAPTPDAEGGVGLWIVNQLCDLVEVRTGHHGTTVRVHAAVV